MLGFEALGIVCALNLLSLAGLPRERILIYAWNPLPLWAFASDGHVDAIVVGLLGAALLLRARHSEGGWAGATVGAVPSSPSCLPLVMAPGLPRGVSLMSVPAGAGPWPSGSRLPFCGVLRRATDTQALCRDAGLLAAAAMIAISPHYYWYFAWLALPAVIARRACVVVAGDSSPAAGDRTRSRTIQFIWRSLVYVPATLLLLADLRPRLTIKFRRRVGLGDTVCPLRLP